MRWVRSLSAGRWTALAAALLSLAFCANATALTVEVRDDLPLPDLVVLTAWDAGGEQNDIRAGVVADLGASLKVELVDRAATATAAKGCEGGGAPGVPVLCLIPQPEERDLPIIFELAGGENKLDASTLEFRIGYLGGSEPDTVIAGSGDDDIQPGGGGDVVFGNEGEDRLTAPPKPVGTNRYALGAGYDHVGYLLVKSPLRLLGGQVRTGDGRDSLEGVEQVYGGGGDDVFFAVSPLNPFPPPHYQLLDGLQGDDMIAGGDTGATLVGGEGDDTLVSGTRVRGSVGAPAPVTRLIGEDGDDRYFGADGVDLIREFGIEGRVLAPAGHRDSFSDDLAFGGGGNDLIELGAGTDAARGGGGADQIGLGRGPDLGSGDGGRDLLIGDLGLDRLVGAAGRDRILAAWGSAPGAPRLVDRSDRIDCGGGRDFALVNPWDRDRDCENSKAWARGGR
jgi:Ca2+-binding RTX toxin-like protein